MPKRMQIIRRALFLPSMPQPCGRKKPVPRVLVELRAEDAPREPQRGEHLRVDRPGHATAHRNQGLVWRCRGVTVGFCPPPQTRHPSLSQNGPGVLTRGREGPPSPPGPPRGDLLFCFVPSSCSFISSSQGLIVLGGCLCQPKIGQAVAHIWGLRVLGGGSFEEALEPPQVSIKAV